MTSRTNSGWDYLDLQLPMHRSSLWRTIFTEEPKEFCSADAVCKKGMGRVACTKAIAACVESQDMAVNAAGTFFDDLTLETSRPRPTYIEGRALLNASSGARARIYFASPDDTTNAITCVAKRDIPSPPPPSSADKSPFRVRGASDDLWIDRGPTEFKSTSQASITVTGDSSSSIRTQAVKAKAALVPISGTTLVIPFVSFNQSITTQGKARTIDPTSNVTEGFLATTTIPGEILTQVITAKPQYLTNTKDHSQIASIRISSWGVHESAPLGLPRTPAEC